MALNSYDNIVAALEDWEDDDDSALSAPDYIVMAETKINRLLRVRQMHATVSAMTLDANGNASLPDDFLAPRRAYVNTNPIGKLTFVDPDWLAEEFPFSQAMEIPGYIAIEGDEVQVRPITTSTITFKYYKKVPALSDSNPTNWITDNYPDLYLYALQASNSWKNFSPSRLEQAAALLVTTISEINLDDQNSRFRNMVTQVLGTTP